MREEKQPEGIPAENSFAAHDKISEAKPFAPPKTEDLPLKSGANSSNRLNFSKNIKALGDQNDLPPALDGMTEAVERHGPNVSSGLIKALEGLGLDPAKIQGQNLSRLIVALCKRAGLSE